MPPTTEIPRVLIESDRLRVRELVMGDASFILQLVNEPSWLRHIGDKDVHSIGDAERYITNGPRTSYVEHGFGLYVVTDRMSGLPLGVCGLMKRATLEHPDIGFAFLREYWGRGYAFEAAHAVVKYATQNLRIPRIAAITKPDNAASIRLLGRLGMKLEGTVGLAESDPELLLFLSSNGLSRERGD
jgi:[ribosomal protein S5]-alanine N-acetyltransferase